MTSALSTLKPMLPVGQGINIYPYSAIPITTGHSKNTGTICIMEAMGADPSTLHAVAPTVTRGVLHLFDVAGGLRVEKKVWILEKAGMDAVWEKRSLLTRCEEENAWMKVEVQEYLGTDSVLCLFRGAVSSEEPGKVSKWADHILVSSVMVNLMGILRNNFRMTDIALFFVRPYLQFVPREGEPTDSILTNSSFLSRLQRDWKETKDWEYRG